MGVYGTGSLVFPDQVTIAYPSASPLLDGRARQPLGRARYATVELHGQLELAERDRRGPGTLGADENSRGVLMLDAVECARAGYTPEAGTHRLISVTHHETGVTQTFELYFDSPTPDAAGRCWNITLRDKQPARQGA